MCIRDSWKIVVLLCYVSKREIAASAVRTKADRNMYTEGKRKEQWGVVRERGEVVHATIENTKPIVRQPHNADVNGFLSQSLFTLDVVKCCRVPTRG